MAPMHFTPCTGAWAPLDAALRLARRPGLAWLDGGLSHGREGRYSFVGAAPCEVRTAPAREARPLALLAQLGGDAEDASEGPLRAHEVPRWVGYVSYDAAWAGSAQRRLV